MVTTQAAANSQSHHDNSVLFAVKKKKTSERESLRIVVTAVEFLHSALKRDSIEVIAEGIG